MSINDINNSVIRSTGTSSSRRTGRGGGKESVQETARVDRSDRVEISDEGRARAARSAEEKGAPESGRIDVILGRIEDGTYDRPEVVEEVARRILNSGDL